LNCLPIGHELNLAIPLDEGSTSLLVWTAQLLSRLPFLSIPKKVTSSFDLWNY
jgi:hypothetical protein